MTDQVTKSRRGCLFYGGVIAGIILIVVIIGGILGLRYAKRVVDQLTDTEPMLLPKVQLADNELLRLRDRIEDFQIAVRDNQPAEPLALTDVELNALIATDTSLTPFRDRIHVTIRSNQFQAQMSIPAEEIGLEALRGRYVNATGILNISLKDGVLRVNAENLSAKGEPLPEKVMRQIQGQNLAEQFNQNASTSVALNKLQEIKVVDGKIVIVPKKRN